MTDHGSEESSIFNKIDQKDRFKLALDFVEMKRISVLTVFLCHSKKDELEILAELMDQDSLVAVKFVSDSSNWIYPMYHKMVVFLDLDCTQRQLIQVDPGVRIFNGSYSWLLWSSGDYESWFKEIPLFVDADVTLATPSDSNVNLFRVSKIHPESSLNFTKVGSWNFMNGLHIEYNDPKIPDFQGLTLVVSTVLTNLPINLDDITERDRQISDKSFHPELDIVNRYFFVVNNILRNMLNYTWDVKLLTTWGYQQPDGHFNGMIGTLENGTSDYAIGPAQPLKERMNVVDFLIPIHGFRLCFILRQPKTLGTYRALAFPLDVQVWAIIFSLAVLCAFCYTIIYSWVPDKNGENAASLSGGLLLSVGALAQQGLVANQRKVSGRTLSVFILFLGIMSLAYYNAAIMNSLLSPSPVSIRNVDQLIRSPIQLGFLNIPYLISRIVASDPRTAGVVKKMHKGGGRFVDTLAEGVNLIREGGFAFYAEDSILYSEIDETFKDSEKCDLSEIEMLPSFPVSNSIHKKSPFIETLNRGIILLMERGILYREDKVWYAQRPQCLGSQSVLYVSLEAVSIAFWILSSGFALSAIFLLAELLTAWCIIKSSH